MLGILRHLDVASLGHYTESPESLYFMSHALRRAHQELGNLHDPEFFGVPSDVWMSEDYLASIARILKGSLPKKGVDLTKHVQFTTSKHQLAAFGWAVGEPGNKQPQPSGSCELTCVDAAGNCSRLTERPGRQIGNQLERRLAGLDTIEDLDDPGFQ